MPSTRTRTRGRRKANLRLVYEFDRFAYVRWRMKSGAAARLRRLVLLAGAAALGVQAITRRLRVRRSVGRTGAAPVLGQHVPA